MFRVNSWISQVIWQWITVQTVGLTTEKAQLPYVLHTVRHPVIFTAQL